jgi:hypothetical protein
MEDERTFDLLAAGEHIETTPKCEIAHNIERIEIEPH